MPAPDTITVSQLVRLVGTPEAPVVLDVRTPEDFAADPRLVPGALRRDWQALPAWAPDLAAGLAGRAVTVLCHRGLKLSQGVAAWLRHAGARAEVLEGGFEGWAAAGAPLVRPDRLPARDGEGRTVWVTRHRPKVDRIACPWLVRRFVDPHAVFLFVAPSEVGTVAERFGATPFDVEGVFWSHRGERCTFDVMLEEFGLRTEALDRLALIVRGADTARLDLAPEAAGLLAASLGLSRMFRDDLAQLEAGLALYDAFYRWARDATGETHNWPVSAQPGAQARVREPQP
jgi:rhodanese-related sulfurtransferase